MAIRMQISAQDVKSEKVVRPGWYEVTVQNVEEKLASDKQSTNIVVSVVGMEGDAKDVPVMVFFSEKFPAGAIPYCRAMGATISEETGVDPSFDWEATKGRRVKAHIVTNKGKTGEEKARNAVDDWAPLGGGGVVNVMPETGGFEV